MRRMFNWIGRRLKDLFYDPTNEHLDNGRCVVALSLTTLIGAVIWNMHLRKEINLSELGVGLAAILTALVVYLYHDRKTDGIK
jgi:hypothetical protein